jgi:hypothetical protein
MKASFIFRTIPLVLVSALLPAAPSLRLPNEWAAPLESAEGVILVQTETGQARILKFGGSFEGDDSGAMRTNLPGITGLNTGLQSEGVEHAILSSTTHNAVRFLNLNDFSIVNFQPDVPGPITAIPLRDDPGDPASIYQLSDYGEQADVLQRYAEVLAPDPFPSGGPSPLFPVYDLQPSLIPGSPDLRAGVTSLNFLGNIGLWEVRAVPGGTIFDPISGGGPISTGGTVGEKIASQCRGGDGRLCVIRYQPGASTVGIVTQSYFGFSFSSATSNALPFEIGRIIAVPPGVPGAPHGVIITDATGAGAVYAHITLGTTLAIQASFEPAEGNILTGLLPVRGHGLLVLEGPAESAQTTVWHGMQENGGNWERVSSGELLPWLPAQTDFATLFWFNSTPLIDPGAEIVKTEIRGDWTRKTSTAAIPAQIELSQLLTADQGLTPFALESPGTVPPGATFLLTSQREDHVSITSLGTDLALQIPSVTLNPPSGNYDNPVTLTALFDDDVNEFFFREEGSGDGWIPFETQTIGYPSSWLFYARNRSTGVAGPILRRDFTFAGINPNSFDSDNDGVPDYVERHLGLDPAGGPDTDGDFQSDLEEILANNDPADPDSNIPPSGTRNPPFLGEGFEMIAQAFDATGQGASPANDFDASTVEDDFPGETLRAFDMHGNLIAEENVVELASPPVLAGQDGASMQIGADIEEVAWITLASPTNFGVLDVLEPAWTGREIIKVMQRPVNPVAEVVTNPVGTDRDTDASAWITAAQIAHGSHVTVNALTELRPIDNVLSALAEQAIFSSLKNLDAAEQLALGVPASITGFTLFPQRDGESAKTSFSSGMWEALRSAGCDFPAMLSVLTPVTADANIQALANQITNLHVSESANTPLMALPLDVFRSIIQTGAIVDPAPGDPARDNPYDGVAQANIDSAKTTFDSLLAQVPGTKRPVETWFIVIAPSTTQLHNYDYLRQGTTDKVWLSDRGGDRVLLEQGLGLAVGTVYEITGFTDATAPAGFLGFEPIRVNRVVAPLASDTDTNANLLDDGWENVFFGDLGVVGPFDPHPDTGHSYLQYHLSGADPRAGNLTGPIVTLFPTDIQLVWVPAATAFDLTFNFPPEYLSQFEFTVKASGNLEGFSPATDVGPVMMTGPGSYRMRISVADSNLPANFFQLEISLK